MNHHLRRWARRYWHFWGAVLLLAYFGYHGLHGQRGLFAWGENTRGLQQAQRELGAVRGKIGALERKIAALQPDRADRDLLEEQLRALGYIERGEVIVTTPPAARPR